MPALTIHDLSEEAYRGLEARAKQHGRSTEAEIRDILEAAVRPPERVRLGSLLAKIGREAGLTNADCAVFDQVRDRSPGEPANFGAVGTISTPR